MSVIWDVRLPIDLFLGGVGVGAFLLAIVLSRYDKEYKDIVKVGAYLAPVSVLVGILIMATEVGQPGRMLTGFWFRTNFASAFGWGGWLQGIFIALSAAYAWLLYKGGDEGTRRMVGYAGAVFAIAVGAYHGLLLSLVETTRPVWNAVVPVLFITSALTTGVAAVMLIAAVKTAALDAVKKLAGVLGVLLGIQAFLLLVYLLSLARNDSAEAVLGMQALISGSFAMAFWLGAVLLGVLVPLGALAVSKSSSALRIATVLVLLGGFALRYTVMMAGMDVPIPL